MGYKTAGKKKFYKRKPKKVVSEPVKKYVKEAVNKIAVEKKVYSTGNTATITNYSTNAFQSIFEIGVIPRYDPSSTSIQEGSLFQARVKNDILLRHFSLDLYFWNKSNFNQFIRVIIHRNSNIYEPYDITGSNICEDSAGSQVPYSLALLQGQRLNFNSDLVATRRDFIYDKVFPLPYDSSYEGGSLPISYVRHIRIGKKIMRKLHYEKAPDDVSAISPTGGRFVISIWAINGQGANDNNCPIDMEWQLKQFYEE